MVVIYLGDTLIMATTMTLKKQLTKCAIVVGNHVASHLFDPHVFLFIFHHYMLVRTSL